MIVRGAAVEAVQVGDCGDQRETEAASGARAGSPARWKRWKIALISLAVTPGPLSETENAIPVGVRSPPTSIRTPAGV